MPRADGLVIVDVAGRTQASFAHPGVRALAWAPDSHAFAYAVDSDHGWADDLYVYDVQRAAAAHLLSLRGETAGLGEFVWSPDSRFIALDSCPCSTPAEPYTATQMYTALVWRIEVATQQVETVGTIKRHFAGREPLCWTADGRVITTTKGAALCAHAPYPGFVGSHDGTRRVSLGPRSPGDVFGHDPRLLVMATTREGAAGPELWRRKLELGATRVFWSPDDRYLLLDDEDPHSPIWRLRADGTGQLEVVVDDGYLLDVVPQWDG